MSVPVGVRKLVTGAEPTITYNLYLISKLPTLPLNECASLISHWYFLFLKTLEENFFLTGLSTKMRRKQCVSASCYQDACLVSFGKMDQSKFMAASLHLYHSMVITLHSSSTLNYYSSMGGCSSFSILQHFLITTAYMVLLWYPLSIREIFKSCPTFL